MQLALLKSLLHLDYEIQERAEGSDKHKLSSSHLARAKLSLVVAQGSLDSEKQMHEALSKAHTER